MTVNFENCGKRVINVENINLEKFKMKINELKSISEGLIDTFKIAGKVSIDLFAKD